MKISCSLRIQNRFQLSNLYTRGSWRTPSILGTGNQRTWWRSWRRRWRRLLLGSSCNNISSYRGYKISACFLYYIIRTHPSTNNWLHPPPQNEKQQQYDQHASKHQIASNKRYQDDKRGYYLHHDSHFYNHVHFLRPRSGIYYHSSNQYPTSATNGNFQDL